MLGRNEDQDSYFKRCGPTPVSISLFSTILLVPMKGYDYGIDPVIIDVGSVPGFYDAGDVVFYEGLSGLQNLFGSDRINNDDFDYFMFDGFPRSARNFIDDENRAISGPRDFLPYYDEIYVDNAQGGVRFQLDASDALIYAGTNQWPPGISSILSR